MRNDEYITNEMPTDPIWFSTYTSCLICRMDEYEWHGCIELCDTQDTTLCVHGTWYMVKYQFTSILLVSHIWIDSMHVWILKMHLNRIIKNDATAINWRKKTVHCCLTERRKMHIVWVDALKWNWINRRKKNNRLTYEICCG